MCDFASYDKVGRLVEVEGREAPKLEGREGWRGRKEKRRKGKEKRGGKEKRRKRRKAKLKLRTPIYIYYSYKYVEYRSGTEGERDD